MADYSLVTSNNSRYKDTANNSYQGFSGILGLLALIVGAIYLNSAEEVCPWSPKLPVFLLTYGVVSLCSPLVFCVMTCFGVCCCANRSEESKAMAMCCTIISGTFLSLAVNIGLTIWGFTLLYSQSTEVTYHEYGLNATARNANYCNQLVYLVPMVIAWLSAIGYAIFAIVLFCLVCILCIKK